MLKAKKVKTKLLEEAQKNPNDFIISRVGDTTKYDFNSGAKPKVYRSVLFLPTEPDADIIKTSKQGMHFCTAAGRKFVMIVLGQSNYQELEKN